MDYAIYREYRGARWRYIAAPLGLVGPSFVFISAEHCPRDASERGLYLNDANLAARCRPYTKREADKKVKGLNKHESNW